MTSELDNLEDRVIAMLNTRLSNGEKDFGKIIEYVVIIKNCAKRYVFITDTGKKIDALSAMRFMNAYRRKLANKPAIVYPDGTDNVLRKRKIRVRRSGSHSVTSGVIPTTADLGNGEKINISSTVTSAGEFPEDYVAEKEKDKPKGMTIDMILEKSGTSINEYFSNKERKNNE